MIGLPGILGMTKRILTYGSVAKIKKPV